MALKLGAAAPTYFPRRISQYVPAMEYVENMRGGKSQLFSLGTPTVADADGILNDAAAEATAQSYDTSDFATTYDATNGLRCTYGRNLTMVGTSGSDHVVTVIGRDYLNQPMRENMTLSGTTTIVGKKAFKFVDSVSVAAGQAGDTFDLGWGSRLGLPYTAADVEYVIENGVIVDTNLRTVTMVSGAIDITGTNAASFTAPISGWLVGSSYYVSTAVTTDFGVMDATLNTTTGLTAYDFTVPIAAIGIGGSNLVAQGSWQAITQGDIVAWTSDGDPATGGAIVTAIFAHNKVGSFIKPIKTDPQTATTGDPRGLYEPVITLDGAKEIVVCLRGDPTRNSDGNGGLHGIAHYNG